MSRIDYEAIDQAIVTISDRRQNLRHDASEQAL